MSSDIQPGDDPRRAPLTDRVNSEPPIVNGMSATEAGYVGSAAFMASVLLGVLLYALTGYWYFIFGIAIIGPLATLWYASLHLQTVKRNKPEGWYVQAARLWLANAGIGRSTYLRHHGFFELGRRLDFDVIRNAPHDKP